ncbi:MAG: DUF4097 family beta strand repeat-containing protein [Butyricicoccus sp.]|nr:DUF4097 family beta strand repeat-containing protein [Butyricicoccus sp.]MDY4086710.1 DUF4097 family beta strand repeat-containing protein [Butyricicoccus intestinisimiae]
MKTWLKTALLSGVLCCAVGTVLTAAGMLTGGKQYVQAADINTLRGDARKTDSDSLAVLNKQKISGVQALDLALDNLDLKIVPSDDDCCYLSYRIAATDGETPLTYTVQNGTLHLKENDAVQPQVHIDVDFLTDFLTFGRLPEDDNDAQTVILSVPKSQLKQLDIRSSYGDISMRGISAARGSIHCDNGDISLNNCQLSQLTLNNDYGDIDLELCTLDTAAVQLSNGGFDAQETAFSGENSITSSYGDVSVSDTLANLQALTIQASTAYGEISVPDGLRAQIRQTTDDDLTDYCHSGTGGSLRVQADNGDIELSDD